MLKHPEGTCDYCKETVEMIGKVGDFGLAKLLIEGSGDGEDATAFLSTTNSLRGSIGYIPPEYGAGQKPSTAVDVYSFGIMLLQLLTGKSPTDELFMGGLSLRNWVHMSFPGNIDQILDSELLMEETQGECLLTIIGVGLSCTNDSPNGRITIREALRKLKSVGETLLNPRRR